MKSSNNFPEIFYLDRPKVANALDVATAQGLRSALKELEKSQKNATESRGFVIASKLPRVFCAGGDLQSYKAMKTKAEGVRANSAIREVLASFVEFPFGIVAAVEGETIGGGCELMLACDHIVAGSSARFAFRQSKLNLTPGWGGAKRLLKRVRPAIALDWLTSGRTIEPDEAWRTGLIDEICPAGRALERAQAFLTERSGLSPALWKALKDLTSQEGLHEEKIFDNLWFSEEHREVLRRL